MRTQKRVFAASGVVLLLAGVCAMPRAAAGQGIWAKKADLPTPRFMMSACTVDGRIYVVGGFSPAGSSLGTMEVYDPATDTWERKSSMPTPRSSLAACAVDGSIYALAGGASPFLATVEVYDPASDTWQSKASIPTARTGCAACAVDGIIYVIGGLVDPTTPTAVVEAYDPATNQWMSRSSMPKAAGVLSACVVDGIIYTFGGGWGGASALPDVFAYDPRTDRWTRRANLPTARFGLAVGVLDGRIYAMGGMAYGGGPGLATVQVYDPRMDTWTQEPDMPTPRKALAGEVVGGSIYLFGGMQTPASVEAYKIMRLPPDLNADGKVDTTDLLRLIEAWGKDDPWADVAPAGGDGVVDELDLEFLMGYWGQHVNDPTLLAHWTLDEESGANAVDSVQGHLASVLGGALWRPDAGKVGGALQSDGIDDCVLTGFALNPADGPFSAVIWIRGGAPGRVILSQKGGANWLLVDPDGRLMTELKGPGRNGTPLTSAAVLTDGAWHRVAFTWDGLNRILYVDGVEVARDTQANLTASADGLYLGAGYTLAAGSYWSGLIDDVRIYNRAVRP